MMSEINWNEMPDEVRVPLQKLFDATGKGAPVGPNLSDTEQNLLAVELVRYDPDDPAEVASVEDRIAECGWADLYGIVHSLGGLALGFIRYWAAERGDDPDDILAQLGILADLGDLNPK